MKGVKPVTLWQGDCMDRMREIPDRSVDLLLADPPYNIGVQTQRAGKKRTNAWDKIENYAAWTVEWVKLACKKLKPNGVAYIWQGDAAQMAQVMEALRRETPLVLQSLCIWDKGGCVPRAVVAPPRSGRGECAAVVVFRLRVLPALFPRARRRGREMERDGAGADLQQSKMLRAAETVVRGGARAAGDYGKGYRRKIHRSDGKEAVHAAPLFPEFAI